MKRIWLALAVVASGVSGRPLSAQTAPPSGDRTENRPPRSVMQVRQMYEDVAVFRTLLNRAVERSYGFPLQVPFQHGKTASVVHQIPLAEGVYLPGRGVIYSLSAPPPLQDPLARDPAPLVKELSPWEQARRELRGEKVTTPKEAAPRRASLTESVLRLLADNGRNFKQLGDNESITVAVTFRAALDCARCHQYPFPSGKPGMMSRFRTGPGAAGPMSGSPPVGGPSGSPGGIGGPAMSGGIGQPPPVGDEAQNFASVGDLHMRQKRYREAMACYERALQVCLRAFQVPKSAQDVKTLLKGVEIANKLSQASQAAGDREGAARSEALSLTLADAAVKLAASLKGKPVEGTSGLPLPSKLIVSVPKKMLEQVGSGKMSFEEFRKSGAAEYLQFPPRKEEPRKP